MEEDYGKFEPKINDFGDDYHKPDDMLYGSANEAIRKIRRKYRNYNDYLDAVSVITEYLEGLMEKYGKENFLWLYDMGAVTEFIPPMPKYRKTEQNLLQARYGCYISKCDQDKQEYELSDEFMQRVSEASVDFGEGMEVRKGHLIYLPVSVQEEEISKAMDDADTIARELEILEAYSEEQAREFDGKKKGKKSRSLAKETKRRKKALEKARQPLSFGKIVQQYEDECNGLVPEEYEGMRFYRGILIPHDDFNSIEVAKGFEAAGFDIGADTQTIDSKKLRKMVRSDKKPKKKDKKKKEQDEFDAFLDEQAANSGYGGSSDFGTSFGAWQREMQTFTAAKRYSGMDT